MNPLARSVLDLAVRIQQIPAPTFAEAARAEFVRGQMEALCPGEVEMDDLSNVYARIPGRAGGRPVVASAHLDTVFPEDTPLDIIVTDDRITGPGIGDNSLAVAGLFGVARMVLAEPEPLPGDLWLVANVGEEGLGNLCGMRRVVDRFGDAPAAYIVLEGTALGHVYHRGLHIQRCKLAFHTQGGHSWAHFGRPSAIHELAKWIASLTEIELPAEPRSTYNAGPISGGTTVNTIAASASTQIDLRSETEDGLQALVGVVEGLTAAARREGVEVELNQIGSRPGGGLPEDHPLVTMAMRSLVHHGFTPTLKTGSTDANVPLSRGLPAICIGLTHGGDGHTTGEYILTAPLEAGLRHVYEVIHGAWEL